MGDYSGPVNRMRLLKELVAINSIFPEEKAIGDYLSMALEERGFKVRRLALANGRDNILAEREGSSRHTIGLYGHMDTVPVQGRWAHDPFTLREQGDRLIGLGAYDMKAGVCTILDAAGGKCDATLRIAFGVDEENNSAGAFEIKESGFFKGCDMILVPEINDSPVQQDGTILLGRRGRSVYEIRVIGKSCHAAYGGGVNAISEASRLVAALDTMPTSRDPVLGTGSQFVRSISGDTKSLSYPEECKVVLDRHLVGSETPESVLGELRSRIQALKLDAETEVSLKSREMPYLRPYSVPEGHPAVVSVTQLIEPVYGAVKYSAGRSVADECVLATEAPVLSLGPIGGNAHREDEWVSRASLQKLTKAYRAILSGWKG